MGSGDEDTGDFGFDVGRTVDGAYWIDLPHQCDSWVIVGDEDGWYRTGGEARPPDSAHTTHVRDKAQAVERMERFLAEAQAALERLKALP